MLLFLLNFFFFLNGVSAFEFSFQFLTFLIFAISVLLSELLFFLPIPFIFFLSHSGYLFSTVFPLILLWFLVYPDSPTFCLLIRLLLFFLSLSLFYLFFSLLILFCFIIQNTNFNHLSAFTPFLSLFLLLLLAIIFQICPLPQMPPLFFVLRSILVAVFQKHSDLLF